MAKIGHWKQIQPYNKKAYKKKYGKKKNYTGNKYIQKAPNVEKKYIDNGALATGLTTLGQTYFIGQSVHGTDINERIGNRINVKSIELNATLTTLLPTRFKVVIIVDKQPNATALALGNVYNNILLNFFPQCQRNPTYTQRFAILRNYDFVLNPQQPAVPVAQKLHKVIKCNIPVHYNSANTNTIADVTSNAIYMIVLVDNVGLLSFQSRLRFTDE